MEVKFIIKGNFSMVTNFSLNDNTQKEIVKHLEMTSKLLSKELDLER